MKSAQRLDLISRIFGSGVLAVAGFAAVSAAFAAQPEGGALSLCARDLAQLCAGVEAGNGKKVACLQAHQSQLSPDCDSTVKQRLEARERNAAGTQMAQAPAAPPQAGGVTPPSAAPPAAASGIKGAKVGRLNKKACRAELATLCSTVSSGRTKCLIANQGKLGPECAAAVAVVQQSREVAKAACVLDAAKLCGTARGAARAQCLSDNKAKLSPSCLARIEKRDAKQGIGAAAPGTAAPTVPTAPAKK